MSCRVSNSSTPPAASSSGLSLIVSAFICPLCNCPLGRITRSAIVPDAPETLHFVITPPPAGPSTERPPIVSWMRTQGKSSSSIEASFPEHPTEPPAAGRLLPMLTAADAAAGSIRAAASTSSTVARRAAVRTPRRVDGSAVLRPFVFKSPPCLSTPSEDDGRDSTYLRSAFFARLSALGNRALRLGFRRSVPAAARGCRQLHGRGV